MASSRCTRKGWIRSTDPAPSSNSITCQKTDTWSQLALGQPPSCLQKAPGGERFQGEQMQEQMQDQTLVYRQSPEPCLPLPTRGHTSKRWELTFFPFFIHVIRGLGSPVAWHTKEATPPDSPVWSSGTLMKTGLPGEWKTPVTTGRSLQTWPTLGGSHGDRAVAERSIEEVGVVRPDPYTVLSLCQALCKQL